MGQLKFMNLCSRCDRNQGAGPCSLSSLEACPNLYSESSNPRIFLQTQVQAEYKSNARCPPGGDEEQTNVQTVQFGSALRNNESLSFDNRRIFILVQEFCRKRQKNVVCV